MNNPFPPRFRTKEDALLFLHCYDNSEPFPPDLWIWPFERINGVIHQRPEYRDAPFEIQTLTSGELALLNPDWQTLHLKDCFDEALLENPS